MDDLSDPSPPKIKPKRLTINKINIPALTQLCRQYAA